MDSYILTFPAFIVGAIAVGWWLVKRQLAKADKAQEDNDKEVHMSFEKMNGRLDTHQSDIQSILVDLEKRVTREEMERAFDGIRVEMREGFKQIRDDIRSFLGK